MSNTNAMVSNNIKLCDSIWKYAFKLSKITIIIMNLDKCNSHAIDIGYEYIIYEINAIDMQ